jgi:hypothetical protein
MAIAKRRLAKRSAQTHVFLVDLVLYSAGGLACDSPDASLAALV